MWTDGTETAQKPHFYNSMVDVKWTRTWPDSVDDFKALDTENGGYVGRIYPVNAGFKQGQWLWFRGSASGTAETKQLAADEVRREWKEVCARYPQAQAELWPYHMREKG